MNKTVKDLILVVLGSFIFAAGVNAFIISGNLGEGGVTGLAIILYYAFHISPAITNFLVNAVLIAIFGGVSVGLGIGVIILAGGTTAGTTILARIATKYLDVSTPYALLFFDMIVVAISLTVIPLDKVLVTVISLYIGTKVMEYVIEGLNTKKAMTIISTNPDKLAKAIDEQIGRGLTILNGHGYYTREEKDVLYVVISKTQVSKAKRLIKQIDKDAFLVIHDVRDVYGNGFLADE
ncbi:TPA: YitT family protein [Staphylococcus aureus]|nr:YitT family protein [Staphylococcus aureus]